MKNETKYTSLKFSKELQERADKAGVILPSYKLFFSNKELFMTALPLLEARNVSFYLRAKWNRADKYHCENDFMGNEKIKETVYPAFDILNEICVEHVNFFFGEKEKFTRKILFLLQNKKEKITRKILFLLQRNKKEKAERYILDNLNF